MATQRQLLVLLMTTLMLGTGFAGCLGGDDGGGDTGTDPDNDGEGNENTPPADTDGDGIYDVIDQCANTPAGTVVDCLVVPKRPIRMAMV